jgi:hypothetical protein
VGWVGCKVLVEGGWRGERTVEAAFEGLAFLKTFVRGDGTF